MGALRFYNLEPFPNLGYTGTHILVLHLAMAGAHC
jgi:hypothetical protein